MNENKILNTSQEIDIEFAKSSEFLEEDSNLMKQEIKENPYQLFAKVKLQNEFSCFEEKKPLEKESFLKPTKSKLCAFELINFDGTTMERNDLIQEKVKRIREAMQKIKKVMDLSTMQLKKQTRIKPQEI